jgi:hypothetical protein
MKRVFSATKRVAGPQTRRRRKAQRAFFPLTQQLGDVELRFKADRTLDEIVLVKNGECLFHLEYMARNHVWFNVGDVHVNLYSANSIRAEVGTG